MSISEVAVRNGELVTARGHEGVTDIGISDGKIVQIGQEVRGQVEIDATGMLVLPGAIDAHVHLSIPPGGRGNQYTWVDDFVSGSKAALAGGITTLGNMAFPADGELPIDTLQREEADAREQTIADLFIHPVLADFSQEAVDSIPDLMRAGCNTIKLFTVMPSFDHSLSEVLKIVREAGSLGMLTMIHCEDYSIIEDATDQLIAAGKNSFCHYGDSRPVISEVVATQRAVALTEVTGAATYIVHLSSARAMAVCREAQSRGLPVYVETRPLYLHLTDECLREPDSAKYVGQPPLRKQPDVDALWAGLHEGVIQTVCTDHAPWSLEAKLAPSHTLTTLRPGVANLELMLPMLFSEGVRSGRLSMKRFVEVTSTNAAKLFGLFPRKGTIAVGSDADLVVFDPNLTRTVDSTLLQTNADYSVYEGWQVTGWPVMTLRRGEIVYKDGKVVGKPGSGKIVSRSPTQQP